jgi:hypothetical protein
MRVAALKLLAEVGRLAWPALVLVVPVAALCLGGRFDGLYGQDPYAYYDYAIGPLRESLAALRPLPAFFWPPGYPLLVALLSFVIGPTPAAGVAVSLMMGALTAAFTGLLAAEVWRQTRPAGEGRGWLVPAAAGLLVACHPQVWQSSAVVMADTTGLGAATVGAWALARYARTRRGPWLALAAGGWGFAVLARWIYGLAAVAAAVFTLATMLRRTSTGQQLTARAATVHLGGAAAVALVALAPLILAALTGQTGPGQEGTAFAGNFQVYTWNPLNALRREFVTTDGLLQYRLPNGLYYALAPAHRYYFAPWLAALLLPGLWAARRGGLWWLGLWALLVYGFHAGAPWQNFRFTLAYLTPLAVLAGVGLEVVHGWAGQRWRWGVLALFGLGLAGQLGGAAQLTQSVIARKQGDLETVAQVEAALPPEARLLTFNMTSTFRHYATLETLELYDLRPDEVRALLGDSRPTYVLIDDVNIAQQWADEPLGQTVAWLREGPGLEVLGQYGSLTLYRVRKMGAGDVGGGDG